MDYLEHFGILGMRHGHRNGPPYPLGSGDHSAGEKAAAKAAGVKVGSDSGKGSIENVKKKKSARSKSAKKPLTPEEKREQALAAARNGDKKKIAKNIDDLSTEELRDAAERARLKEQLTKKDPSEVKVSKEDREKREVINSGDKELVRQYASKMTLQELQEAWSKVELTAKVNYEAPPPSAFDKMANVANKLGTMKDMADKGIGAYNTIAKVYNATHKDAEWPLIGEKPKDEKDKKDKEKDKDKEKAKEAVKEVSKEVKKTLEEQYADKLKEEKLKYKNEQEFNRWKAQQEAKEARKKYKKSAAKDFDDENIWNSAEEASAGGRNISDDLTPEEQAFYDSFKTR
jgi:hypothetical protein